MTPHCVAATSGLRHRPRVERATPLGLLILLLLPGLGGIPSPSLAAPPDRVSLRLTGLPNLDDDDGDGTPDFMQRGELGARDDELLPLRLPLDRGPLELFLAGYADSVRVYLGGLLVLGEGVPRARLIAPVEQLDSLRVEMLEPGGRALLVAVDGQGRRIDVSLEAAAPRFPHPLLPVERVYVMQVGSDWVPQEVGKRENDALIRELRSRLGPRLQVLDGDLYGSDVWLQDQYEFTDLRVGAQHMRLVLDSKRDGVRGDAGAYSIEVLARRPQTAVMLMEGDNYTDFDGFGNVEVSPPVQVDGTPYPEGRIFYGRNGPVAPDPALLGLLGRTGQDPFWVETGPLCVGHVDELAAFVPDPEAPRGFRLLFPSAREGLALAHSLGGLRLPRYAPPPPDGFGFGFASDIFRGPDLVDYNIDLEERLLEPARQRFVEELGLLPGELRTVPALYMEGEGGCGAVSLLPNLVNALVLPDGRGGAAYVVSDPHFRPKGVPPEGDPVLRALRASLPPRVELVAVDTWEVYHLGYGGMHCGAAIERVSAPAPGAPPLGAAGGARARP